MEEKIIEDKRLIMTKEEQEIEMQKCIDDPVYFYENYLVINGKSGKDLPELGNSQKEFLRAVAKWAGKGVRQVPRTVGGVRSGKQLMFRCLSENLKDYFPEVFNDGEEVSD